MILRLARVGFVITIVENTTAAQIGVKANFSNVVALLLVIILTRSDPFMFVKL